MTKTLGQELTGWKPDGYKLETVNQIKAKYAEIIDLIDSIRNSSDDPQVKRMASVAITESETASMWAVKSATWQK